jgi:hypothetical protein
MSKFIASLVLAIAFFVAASFPDLSQAYEPTPLPVPASVQQDLGENQFIMGDGAHKRAMVAAQQSGQYHK